MIERLENSDERLIFGLGGVVLWRDFCDGWRSVVEFGLVCCCLCVVGDGWSLGGFCVFVSISCYGCVGLVCR